MRMAAKGCALREKLRPGLQSLSGGDRQKVVKESRRFATDSMSFDEVMPNAPTFDYLIGTRTSADLVVALEIHPATSSEVQRMLQKQEQTKPTLERFGCGLCSVDAWIWVSSGSVDLPYTSPKRRLLADKRILGPHGRVDLRNPTGLP